jgi:predicted transposase YdaD
MSRVRPEDFVRHFRENGLKLLLHDPGNVRDLLALRDPARAARCDFARLRIDPTSYVAADYRHLAAALVLRVPYRTRLGGRRRTLTLYILIEHQSEPDALMLLRVLDYLVQIYKGQVRAWDSRHDTRAGFRLQPVLPIVFYTGERPWPTLLRLAELVDGAEEFAEVLPQLQPLFISLPAVPAEELEAAGGALGWVLALLQRRGAAPDDFRALLGRAVEHLEGMAEAERNRWLLLLACIQVMFYHDRPKPEHAGLHEVIVRSVRSDPRRREVEAMAQTIAEALREEGRAEGRAEGRNEGRAEGAVSALQAALLTQLRIKFHRVPRATGKVVRATDDLARLNEWLARLVTAASLEDVGIDPADTPR